MRLLGTVLLAGVLLSGCTGHCGMQVDEVRWDDDRFAGTLLDAPAPGWTVRSIDPPAGIPTDDPTVAAWSASVQGVGRSLGPDLRLSLDAVGRLSLQEMGEEPDGLREAVAAALADVTDGNESERRAWTDALLDEPLRVRHRPGGPNGTGEMERLGSYRTLVPPERIDIHGLRVDDAPDRPTHHLEAGDWTLGLALPTVEATRGTQTFTADQNQNRFRDEAWPYTIPKEEALADFRAAYGSLGVGEPPGDAFAGGDVC